MPTISINPDTLFKKIGQTFTEKEFDQLCFDFGIELDDVVLEKVDGKDQTVYKIDIPANRYDLLCVEGLSRNLSIFLEKRTPPAFKLTTFPEAEIIKMSVLPNTQTIRPFVVGAVLRNVSFTKQNYDSFIDLQDKLHHNVCRKRTLVAIGTHDLDTIKGPFRYDARRPTDIKFKPLNQTKEFNGAELMEHYAKDINLKSFLPIIRDSEFYPVIYDANDVVLSMPPIINGEHSKITLNTKNVLIECTATDLRKAEIVLDTIVTMFAEYCDSEFSCEAIQVTQTNGEKLTYPKLSERFETVSVKEVNQRIGIQIEAAHMITLLNKMGLSSEPVDSDKIKIRIPPTRSDILHACDIVEDVAIGFGYNNIVKTIPKTNCFSTEFELNRLSDLLRIELAQSGYTEGLTFTLCSKEDVSDKLRQPIDQVPACHIANPKTLDFQVARTSLLPGLLKTLACSRNMPLPLKLFEVSDVVLRDAEAEVGARNQRNLAVLCYNKSAGFEVVHGVLGRLMQLLEVPFIVSTEKQTTTKTGYTLKHVDNTTYMPGRCAAIYVGDKVIGHVGVLHPDVIMAFELNLPCCALEINIESFV